jgi:short-subunit dehydrogenase
MLERGGAIINISSLSARLPIPYFAPYNAGKAALSAFSQSLLLEFGSRSKVQLLDVQLGDVRTGFNERANCPARGRDPAFDRFFKRLDALISTAPRAAKVAQKIVKTLETGRSGTMVAGGFFQKWLAPLGSRLLPAACLRRVTRRYYHLE